MTPRKPERVANPRTGCVDNEDVEATDLAVSARMRWSRSRAGVSEASDESFSAGSNIVT